MRIILCGILVSLAGTSVGAVAAEPSGKCPLKTRAEIVAGLPEVERYLDGIQKASDVPAVSLAIFDSREIFYAKGYGRDVDPTTPFQAASISKAVAALAALDLAERGALPLDAPLEGYVKKPWLPPQPYTSLVTLRTVLSHTSGLPNDVTGEDRTLAFRPGTRFRYSGGGYVYLQQAIEDSTGMRFDAFMAPRLARLGMTHSTYDLRYLDRQWVNAAFSLVTTPSDLARFLIAVGRPAAGDEMAARAMTTPQVTVNETLRWGLGLAILSCGDDRIFMHGGRNFSLHHSVAIYHERSGTGIVVMARGRDSHPVPFDLAQRILGVDYQAYEHREPVGRKR